MADNPFDGSPTYGLGPSISLIPVDHDPFAVTYVQVDHDPFNDSWAAGSPFGLASPPSDQRNRCPQPWTIYLGRSREVCPPESAVRVAAMWGTIEPTGFRC